MILCNNSFVFAKMEAGSDCASATGTIVVMAKNAQQRQSLNYALNFLNPIAEYETPKMQDKLALAKYLDMIA